MSWLHKPLAWFVFRWRALADRRRQARELTPSSFARLAREIDELADQAERLGLGGDELAARLARIRTEMDQLNQLAATRSFHRLAPEKRRKLRESLLASRKQLLETVHGAPSPTTRLQ